MMQAAALVLKLFYVLSKFIKIFSVADRCCQKHSEQGGTGQLHHTKSYLTGGQRLDRAHAEERSERKDFAFGCS